MNSLKRVWMPQGEGLSESQQIALSVPGKKPKTHSEYRDRVESKLYRLAEEDLADAIQAVENLPEASLVLETGESASAISTGLMWTDQLSNLISRVDLAQGKMTDLEEPESLRSVLESL